MLPTSHKTSYHEKLYSQNNDIRNRILAYHKHIDPKGIAVSNVGGWHSNFFKDLPIHAPWQPDLINAITQSYYEFIDEDPKPLTFDIWMMVSGKDDYIKDHQHLPGTKQKTKLYESLHNSGYPVLSGTYYVSLPSGNEQSFYIKDKANNSEHLNTNEGELTLFYSYIMHGTIKNPSDDPRVSLAFNVVPEIDA